MGLFNFLLSLTKISHNNINSSSHCYIIKCHPNLIFHPLDLKTLKNFCILKNQKNHVEMRYYRYVYCNIFYIYNFNTRWKTNTKPNKVTSSWDFVFKGYFQFCFFQTLNIKIDQPRDAIIFVPIIILSALFSFYIL